MSQRWDQLEARLGEYESHVDALYQLYHLPALAVLMLFMLWVRVRDYGRHIGPEGQPLYRGNDPFYHYRTTRYAVENYPFNLQFDPWTGFDVGASSGQFGTVMDQVVATAALVVGLGSPSQETILVTTLFAGPVFAMLCAVPMFLIGKRLGGRFGGLVAVTILALTPGEFLSRSVAGMYDHHVAETLLVLVLLYATMRMLAAGRAELPIFELVQTREWREMRSSLTWAVGFGVAFALALLVWPPMVFFFFILAVFLFVHLSIEFVRGHSPDHVVIPTVAGLLVTALLFAPFLKTFSLSATDYSILHVLLALAVAGGALFMAGVARAWDDHVDLPRLAYPAAIAGGGLVVVGLLALVLPDTFSFFVSQAERVLGFGAQAGGGTVGEAQPPADPMEFFFTNYGMAFYSAVAGIGLLAVAVLRSERPRPEYLLVVVFTLLILAFTLTQRRFDYYLVIGVGAVNAYVVSWVLRFVDIEDVRRDVRSVEPYQLLVVFAILFIVAAPLLVGAGGSPAVVSAADQSSQPGEIVLWDDSLEWLSEGSPEPGAYGSGDDDTRLDHYGTYEPTDDFEYADGEYGVLAWWDYGHYITTRGERIPVANPFQQHATESADFLLADDEDAAIDALDEDTGEGEGVQYVMVDHDLGVVWSNKYFAPTHFESRHDIDEHTAEIDTQQGSVDVPTYPEVGIRVLGDSQVPAVHTQRAYESMRVQLYQYHGSAIEPSTNVLNFGEGSDLEEGYAFAPEDDEFVEEYESPEEARTAAENDSNAMHGGIDGPSERVEALEHFRMVHGGETTAAATGMNAPSEVQSWVKTYERVDGATVEGTGPADSEVRASVEMEVPTTDETFVYTQYAETDADGNFEMTLPYSTTGYDEWGTEEGYTDVDVRANGSYSFSAIESADEGSVPWTADAEVTEGQVIGEDDSAVEVDMEEGDPEDLFDSEPAEEGDDGDDDESTTDDETQSRVPAVEP